MNVRLFVYKYKQLYLDINIFPIFFFNLITHVRTTCAHELVFYMNKRKKRANLQKQYTVTNTHILQIGYRMQYMRKIVIKIQTKLN